MLGISLFKTRENEHSEILYSFHSSVFLVIRQAFCFVFFGKFLSFVLSLITQVLARKAKNQYSWKGFGAIPKALEELRVIHVSNFVVVRLMFIK